MIINFRYHIFTITAIFAALGLGILIGSSIIGHEGLVEEQEKLINNIANSIKQLSTENMQLKSELGIMEERIEYYSELEIDLLGLIVEEWLYDREYLLVYPENEDLAEENNVNVFEKIGLKTGLVKGIQRINENKDDFDGVIFCNLDPEQQEDFLKINVGLSVNRVIYNHNNIAELVLKLLEEETGGS